MEKPETASSIVSSSPQHEIAVRRTRPRANTEDLEPPRPEPLPKDYSDARVQAGIDYAERRLNSTKRKPSPILEKLLLIYKGACSEFLRQKHKKFENVRQNKLLSEIRGYEEEMARRPWVCAVGDEYTESLQREVVKLRRLQFFARYGDYTQRVAHLLRDSTRRKQTESWREVSGTFKWSDISERITSESRYWKLYGSSKGLDDVETTYAVYQGCETTGIGFKQALAAIHTYGARNEARQNSINDLVAEGRWTDIATTLAEDLRDLSNTMPIELKDEEAEVRAILLQLRDQWFTMGAFNSVVDELAQPWMWLPTPQLIQECMDSRTPEKRQAARRANEDQVAQGAAKRIQKLDEEKELVQHLSTELEANAIPAAEPIPPRRKREPSQEASVQDRKKAWRTIQDQQRRARASYRASLGLQGEVNRVVSHYKGQFGSSPPPQE